MLVVGLAQLLIPIPGTVIPAVRKNSNGLANGSNHASGVRKCESRSDKRSAIIQPSVVFSENSSHDAFLDIESLVDDRLPIIERLNERFDDGENVQSRIGLTRMAAEILG